MEKKCGLGIFVEAGGNKVFFANGALNILRKEGIIANKIVGFSSSAPIVFAYLENKNEYVASLFAEKLDANRKNFYLFRKEHFPHNRIYKNAVEKLLRDFEEPASGEFLILASATSPRWTRTKALICTLVLALKFSFRTNFLPLLRKTLKAHRVELVPSNFSYETAVPFVMGSSTLFPFIQPHVLNDSLVLEGALLEPNYKNELRDCKKKIVIHTTQGETGSDGDTFHFYSKEVLPNNVLDYTDGSKILAYHQMGEEEAKKSLSELKDFLAH